MSRWACRRCGFRQPSRSTGGLLLGFLGARAVAGVEEVTGGSYRRSVSLKNGAGVVSVRPEAAACARSWISRSRPTRTRRWRGSAACSTSTPTRARSHRCSASDPLLGPLVQKRPGLRLPGAVDGFELAVRAIVGQQVSVAGARTVLGGLVERYGRTGRDAFPEQAAPRSDPSSFPFPRARGSGPRRGREIGRRGRAPLGSGG